MKKVFIILTLLVVLFMSRVSAGDDKAELHKGRLDGQRVTIKVDGEKIKDGYFYQSTLAADGKESVAFCLDAGKAASGKFTITKEEVELTENMRRAYAYTRANSGTDNYVVSQMAIWLEQSNVELNHQTLQSALVEAQDQGYLKGQNVSQLVQNYFNTPPSSSDLSAFSSTKSGQQRFLSALHMQENGDSNNPDNPDKPDKPNDSCKGYQIKKMADPAVCVDDDGQHTGEFYEVVDTSQCGNASEAGAPVNQIGTYCKLYCLEDVAQEYSGGLSTPYPVGTNLKWPSIVKYTGTKKCRVMVDVEKDPINDLNEIVAALNGISTASNRREFASFISSSGVTQTQGVQISVCDTGYAATLKRYKQNVTDTKETVEKRKKTLSDTKNYFAQLESKKHTYDYMLNNSKYCENTCEKDKGTPGYGGCMTNCEDQKSKAEKYVDNINAEINDPRTGKNFKIAAAQQQLTQAESAYEAAVKRLNDLNKKITSCKEYIRVYNGAVEVLKGINTCNNYQLSADLYQFESSTSMAYADPEFGTSYGLVPSELSEPVCDNCQSTPFDIKTLYVAPSELLKKANDMVETIQSKEIFISRSISYQMPDGGYRYVSKRTNKPLTSPVGDVIDLGGSFLPTSFNATPGQYPLYLIVNSLGENGKFTSLANASMYTCHYTLTKDPETAGCVCPPGTDRAGEDLSGTLGGNPPTSCLAAQIEYCNIPTSDELTYCPAPYGHVDITSCMQNKSNTLRSCMETNGCSLVPPPPSGTDPTCPDGSHRVEMTNCIKGGNAYEFCKQEICFDPSIDDENPDQYKCPPGTDYEGKDLKACVYQNLSMGKANAYQYCKKKCNDIKHGGNSGLRIIYRTISLRNPFPGKSAGLSKVTNHFSLDNLYGRYPGANWNSPKLVKREILMNRGVEADAVYNKEPLYTFILDSATIKEWRRYNDAQEKSGGYADYTLDCDSSGYACISSVIRNPAYGLQTSQSACSSSSHSEFYVCSES